MVDAGWRPKFSSEAPLRDGIYRYLDSRRLSEIEAFLAHYRRVRQDDGYRQDSPDYFRSLPYVDSRHPQAASWRIRQESFRHLASVLRQFGNRRSRVLDLGAGSGWLTARLTALEHCCVAVDWLDDREDGLGAFGNDGAEFTRIQADFDDLPLAKAQFDVVIFNASLHYSFDPARTLRQAREMLVPGGMLVVMDSPVFASDEAGRRMLAAQGVDQHARYGTSVRCGVGYLTERDMMRAAVDANLEVRWLPSRGSLGWALRRWLAGLKQRRAPAKFGLWFGVWQPASS